MEPGIYFDIPYVDYEKIDGMRPSTLKYGGKSMLHLSRAIAGECQPDPKSVAVGSAAHCILAGELEDRYRIMPPFELDPQNVTLTGRTSTSKSTDYYKDSVELWRLENADKEELTEVQVHTASLVANKVRDRFGALLDASKQEVVVIGSIEGVPMKTRLDGLHIEDNCVWDLKTTTDISDTPFFRVFDKLGYGFSAAVHVELLRQCGFEVERYSILAAEVKDDYDVRRLEVPFILMENAIDKVREVATNYKMSKKLNVWPGLPDKAMYYSNWAMEEWEPEEKEEKELSWSSEE